MLWVIVTDGFVSGSVLHHWPRMGTGELMRHDLCVDFGTIYIAC